MTYLEKAGLTLLHLVAASLKISKAGQEQASEISNGIAKLAAVAAEDVKFIEAESRKALDAVITSLENVLPELHKDLNPQPVASKDAYSTFSTKE